MDEDEKNFKDEEEDEDDEVDDYHCQALCYCCKSALGDCSLPLPKRIAVALPPWLPRSLSDSLIIIALQNIPCEVLITNAKLSATALCSNPC